MSISDIKNIEQCELFAMGSTAYRIIAKEGWYIHNKESIDGGTEDNPTKIYKKAAIIYNQTDCSNIEITAEKDLPPNAEIC
jgi:hypothetical protein